MKTFTYEKTSHPDLFRVVDREGNWTHYVLKPDTKEQVFLGGVTSILGAGFSKGPRFYEYLKNGNKEQLDRSLQLAGERGDRVHQFISRLLSGEKLDRFSKVADDHGNQVELENDEWDCILAFQEFWNRHDCTLVAHEFAVYKTAGAYGLFSYAGTVDAVLRIRKACGVRVCNCKELVGKVGLIDWKSSGGIYPDYGAQVSAYAHAENLPSILESRKLEYTAIVRLGTNHKTTGGYEFKAWDLPETTENYQAFMASNLLSGFHMKAFKPEEIEDIPDTLSLVITKDELPKTPKKPRRGAKVAKQKAQSHARPQQEV